MTRRPVDSRQAAEDVFKKAPAKLPEDVPYTGSLKA